MPIQVVEDYKAEGTMINVIKLPVIGRTTCTYVYDVSEFSAIPKYANIALYARQ